LGTAGIARKNWHSIRNSGNGVVVAVASRDPQKAARFVDECQAAVPFPHPPRATTYEELLLSPDVDAVYVPLPTGIRRDWVIRAAQARKHVVCEKPCGVHAGDVAAMVAACRDNQVQFMDGVMFAHSRRLERMREILQDGHSIGEIRRITSQFSFRGDDEFQRHNIRVNGQLEPLGCLGDLGWYNIRLTLWLMDHQLPESVSGRLLRAVDGPAGAPPVPLEFSGELFFPGGVTASFYCSFVTEMQQWADVSGTLGRLFLRDFVLPYYGSEVAFDVYQDVFSVSGCQFNMEEHARRVPVSEYSNNAPSAQESNLFRNFGHAVQTAKLEPHWAEAPLLVQRVLDACLESSRSDGKRVPV
ncbi:MAG: Gfo/Idh/MocA family protein, partial [Pirellulaceae bacterium]